MHSAWVYILTSEQHSVLYVGVTTAIATRLWEHKTKMDPKSFSARYNISKLVYIEGFETLVEAIRREKFIKGKSRSYKIGIINRMNPGWDDLAWVVGHL
jgi:putative endonuclease